GDEERHAELGLDSVREEVDDLDVDVRDVEVARDAELRLSCLQEAEGALDGLLHRPGHAAGQLELAGTVRDGDFDAVQADGTVGCNARAVYGARSEGIGGDEIATALLGHADELLLARLVVRVAEGRVVVLEGAHLLELLLHPAAAFYCQLEDLAQLVARDLAVREED